MRRRQSIIGCEEYPQLGKLRTLLELFVHNKNEMVTPLTLCFTISLKEFYNDENSPFDTKFGSVREVDISSPFITLRSTIIGLLT